MNAQDPFHTAQNDIQTLLTSTRSLHESYTRIARTARGGKSPELLSARGDLLAALEELSGDLQDLVDSVNAVEGDPYRYGLQVEEVARRRAFVKEVADEVQGMREELVQGVAARKASGGGALPDPDAFEVEDEDGYAAYEEERQQELIAEQDEQLDGVFRTVGNLRLQADEMGRELEEQGQLLDTVDTLTDRVGGKLQNGVKKIGWVIKKNEDSASSCCIGVLIFVLILLLIMILLF